MVERNGWVSGTFLDITDRVLFGGEQGLLGLAFPPDYSISGRFFVYYTNRAGDNQISSFQIATSSSADPMTENTVLVIEHPDHTNHNGGDLNFGPRDGFLYVSTGDGGGAGDPNDNAQDVESLLGKILRLDITGDDFPDDATRNYSIPRSNPFVDQPGADEVWALGLRNPWRFSFDSLNGNMFIGDVGQGLREEIDFEKSRSRGGANYGWRCYEGSLVFQFSGCSEQTSFVFPVAEYAHDEESCAVTGGYVYRGSRYPRLRGWYFYMDFCSGDLYVFHARRPAGLNHRSLGTIEGRHISSFGQSANGEIFATDLVSGTVHHLQLTN